MRYFQYIKTFFILPLLLFSLHVSAQNHPDCEAIMKCRIIAPSGMNMRTQPNTSGKIITKIPKDSIVHICEKKEGELILDQIQGYWRKAVFQNKTGYIWDGYLEVLEIHQKEDKKEEERETEVVSDTEMRDEPKKRDPEPKKELKKPTSQLQFLTESHNYCGDIREIDPSLIWFGFYPNGKNYDIRPVEIEILVSKHSISEGMEYDIRTQNEEPALFLVGYDKAVKFPMEIENRTAYFQRNKRQIMPGQRLDLYPYKAGSKDGQVTITALGNVTSIQDCPVIEGYKLMLTAKNLHGETAVQEIGKLLPTNESCVVPDLFWFGDLNNDGYTDIILVNVSEEANIFSLLISRPDESEDFYELAAQWRIGDCED